MATKGEFILSRPMQEPAADVVKAGKEAGMTLTVGHVYSVRSASRRKGKKAKRDGHAKRAGATRKIAAHVVRAPSARAPRANRSADDAQLRHLIAELGLSRSREVFADIQQIFGG